MNDFVFCIHCAQENDEKLVFCEISVTSLDLIQTLRQVFAELGED